MKLIIDISEETYKDIVDDAEHSPRNLSHYERIIARGTPLNKIRAEIEKQEKWLLKAGYTAYNVDIAFDAIKAVIAESEE